MERCSIRASCRTLIPDAKIAASKRRFGQVSFHMILGFLEDFGILSTGDETAVEGIQRGFCLEDFGDDVRATEKRRTEEGIEKQFSILVTRRHKYIVARGAGCSLDFAVRQSCQRLETRHGSLDVDERYMQELSLSSRRGTTILRDGTLVRTAKSLATALLVGEDPVRGWAELPRLQNHDNEGRECAYPALPGMLRSGKCLSEVEYTRFKPLNFAQLRT